MERYINQRRLIETFIELIKINSPSFKEKEIGDLLTRKLQKTGCRVEIQQYDRSFNIIARKSGGNRNAAPILLSGHMDTVEPTEGLTFSAENDLIKTTGNTILGADDKSALAQILEAITVIGERDIPHGDIEIVLTSAEERGLVGAKRLDFSRLRSQYALVLDFGGRVGNLVIAAPTHHTYEMRIRGRSAHAGSEPEKGINSIKVAAKIVAEIPDGRIDAETTANIGIIEGGTATNVVPKETVLHGEVRSHNIETLERIKKGIFEAAQTIAAKDGAQVHISEDEEYKAFKIDKDDPFLRFLEGVFEGCRIPPVQIRAGGGSDANIFNYRGIRAINISNGMQNAHSTEEQIHTKDLYDGCLVVLKAITEFSNSPLCRQSDSYQ
ncbi:M20/M25/M40 family metallo-hydrolase [Thermodesulfovibrionales bacterium]|nr:M20/M25/M40 family metallo-hydrolase [Thermodesulfovibrionales bacterium]